MMKRRPSSASWSRGVQAILAAACVALAGCAMEAMDESEAAEMEEGTFDEPFDEPSDESMDESSMEAGASTAEEIAAEEEIAPESAAACVGYGRPCASTAACCGDMVCDFDGYARYCRH
jgi:hypothetical protein